MLKAEKKSTKRESMPDNKLHIISSVFDRWSSLKRSFNNNFEKLLGYKVNDVSSFEKFTQFLYRPTDSASLGVVRALFGLCMVVDVVEERGLADVDIKWGNPWDCHFPLIHGMRPPSLPWMTMIYAVMWTGAFGIALGLRFKIACACFVLPYWYIFLLEKSYWNNHTYLYGVVSILFWGTGANKYFALDANDENRKGDSVPYWNYFILKFQFFLLYFLAGLKKSSREWLEGYAMTNLSQHWVFDPFKMFLTTEQTDFLIVHWFAFIFDLSVGFWMLFERTRIPAMVLCTAFHLMNSRLFSIGKGIQETHFLGMFPYVCLATMPLFCRMDWPRRLEIYFNWKRNDSSISEDVKLRDTSSMKETGSSKIESLKADRSALSSDETLHGEALQEDKEAEEEIDQDYFTKLESEKEVDEADDDERSSENAIKYEKRKTTSIRKKIQETQRVPKVTKRQKFVASMLLCHIALQLFLPYSHFISQGYNNWVPGLYGYSWDMMVHAWDTILVVIKVHDNESNEVRYLDPEAWVQGDRWVKHGDMAMQYAQCLKDNLMRRQQEASTDRPFKNKQELIKLSTNLSIYLDVWCSLNGRFQQRVFNPNVDILTVDWQPFKPISFLMPLLTQYNSYRYKMEEIQQHVYTWSNYTDVLFVADFPGMHLENYVSTDFTNVSLTVLEGEVTYSEEQSPNGISVPKGKSIPVKTGMFHRVKTMSSYPACYMYTYTNQTQHQQDRGRETPPLPVIKNTLPLLKEITNKIIAWTRALNHIINAIFHLVYNVPMSRRVRTIK